MATKTATVTTTMTRITPCDSPEGGEAADHLRHDLEHHVDRVGSRLHVLLQQVVRAGGGRAPRLAPPDGHQEEVHAVCVHAVVISDWEAKEDVEG